MTSELDYIERARRLLIMHNTYTHEGESYQVAYLLPEKDSRPLDAPWWRGKSASIIGFDVRGNFFLRYCDGSVLYWNHQEQSCTTLARSQRLFIKGLSSPPHE